MERSVVYTYDDVFLADLAMSKLKEDGIEAIIEKVENFLNTPDQQQQGYQLLVPLYELEKTIIVLDELDNT
jgi:hypothetical protein